MLRTTARNMTAATEYAAGRNRLGPYALYCGFLKLGLAAVVVGASEETAEDQRPYVSKLFTVHAATGS